jgi:transposase
VGGLFFWTENQTDVPFPSFHILQVPNLIKNESKEAKNKGRKAQGANMYLTLFFISCFAIITSKFKNLQCRYIMLQLFLILSSFSFYKKKK